MTFMLLKDIKSRKHAIEVRKTIILVTKEKKKDDEFAYFNRSSRMLSISLRLDASFEFPEEIEIWEFKLL